MTERPTYLFAGGGTGGHLTCALAVADALADLQADPRVLFLCTDKSIDGRFLDPTPWGRIVQPIRPLPRNPLHLGGFTVRWLGSLRLARRVLRDVKPAAVLGLGGYAAGPAVRVAAGGVRTAMLNPDAVPGKANRYLARRVDAIFTQFEATAGHFAEALRAKVRCVGCPVRREILGADRDAAIGRFGLDASRRTLAVMGGSLGAASVNDAVAAAAAPLAKVARGWQILHVAGPGKTAALETAYRQAGLAAAVVEFCDRMGDVYAAADLLIGRAGANTVAELTATGTPGVLMPYPFHADDHQVLNAADMAAAGAARVVRDAADAAVNAGRLVEALTPILADPPALAAMAAAAASLARTDAAGAVARWLAGLA
ncbi:MAG: UDP-N-acetylglucosamine--N-acetylmuramyl-(pentapeptide) pyrophosphoryl-undecaprenol N-acetylglucosamine transferase [Planctomycetes bacterium]|nr:UDP-N-acetylglucosamine--N-acetylmuramyl-(pentapeptide) pyrophosphoryl-undecaprenol N-acetylglucosamine transferase [Planctomycetota bacterium]